MKKNVMFYVALTWIVMVMTGCNTNMITPEADPQDIDMAENFIVEFSVGDRDDFGPDTKAVKTDWAVDDQILVFFKTQNGSWLNSTLLLLTFDGTTWDSSWMAGSSNDLAINIAINNGNFFAVHHRGSITIPTTITSESEVQLNGYEGGEFMACSGSYNMTFDKTFTHRILRLGEINMELDPNLYQVSIPDINSDAAPSLTIERTNPLVLQNPNGYISLPHYACKSGMLYFDMTNSCLTIKDGTYTDAEHVVNEFSDNVNDMSFCFYIDPDNNPNPLQIGNYRFILKDSDNSWRYTKKRSGTTEADMLTAGYAYRLPDIQNWTSE